MYKEVRFRTKSFSETGHFLLIRYSARIYVVYVTGTNASTFMNSVENRDYVQFYRARRTPDPPTHSS